MNPGFYKVDPGSGDLLYGPNAVYAPSFTLTKETHAEYDYPMDGWYWFDAQDDAIATFVGLGFIYDAANNRFAPPKPHDDCVLNTETYQWDCPT